MESVVRLRLWVPGQEALQEILASAKVSLSCGAPKRDIDGNYVLTLYASPDEAAKVMRLPYRYEADEQYGSVLAERQKQVSKRDRFKGGKVKPEGLGEKR
jgi:hypothetical protein